MRRRRKKKRGFGVADTKDETRREDFTQGKWMKEGNQDCE